MKEPKEHRWYRVEFNDDGTTSTRAVTTPREAENVFHVLACSIADAEKKAHRLKCKLGMRKLGRDRIAQKLCPTCGIAPYEGVNRCAKFCKPTENKLSREKRSRVNGKPPKLDDLPPEAFMTHTEKVKLSTLEAVLAFYRQRPSQQHFERWLVANIKAIKDAQKEKAA